MSDGELTHYHKPNEWKFAWVYETQKQLGETKRMALSIDPGVCTLFTWYSPAKGYPPQSIRIKWPGDSIRRFSDGALVLKEMIGITQQSLVFIIDM
ncbi:hypothetical protein G9A89_010238 [Geosiphon pyriformis]|nr:hypothetical protein G9A89_010238 [Geosiphon pyriformis]